jgi:2-oxoisovalerate dehydrogenase E1 component beta subunit
MGEVPEGYYTVPLDKAAVFRPGKAVTVLAYGTMVWVCEAAARETGIDAEIIDLRSIWPLDLDTIVASVKKTGRCVVVHEATRTSGFGAELSALVQEHCFYHLEAPIERVTGWDTPYPHAQEWAYFPGPGARREAFKRAMEACHGYSYHQDARHRRRHCRSRTGGLACAGRATWWPRTRSWPT